MTRKKKTRSLKRIHNVKTGSKSKLKKAESNDRQSKSRFGKQVKKQKSVYQKYLEETGLKDETAGMPKAAVENPASDSELETKELKKEEPAKEKSQSLFDQFESNKKNDFY